MTRAWSVRSGRSRRRVDGFTLPGCLIGIVILGVLIALALWLFCPDPPPDPAICSEQVDAVEILPKTVHAAAGTSFTMDARVVDLSGGIIKVGACSEMQITWTSATPNLFADNGADMVLIDVPSTPGTNITDIVATVTRTVGNTTTTKASAASTIKITPSSAAGDFVEVAYTPGQRSVSVVIDAGEAGNVDCTVEDWTLAVVRRAWLDGKNLDDSTCSTAQLASFAPGLEAQFETAKAWTASEETRTVGQKPIFNWGADPSTAPNSARWFQVVIGMPTAAVNSLSAATDIMQLVDQSADENRLGIGFQYESNFAHLQTAQLDPTTSCSKSFLNNTMLPLSKDSFGNPFKIEQPFLFVIFVDDIAGTKKGWACDPIPFALGRAVYISVDAFVQLSTVVHEIGHTLALSLPLMGQGHANYIGSLGQDNIMWATTGDARKSRERLSAGQLFRMNIHTFGFANSLSPYWGIECQDEALLATVCPRLDQDPGT
jgi:hypothetical protein